jgi:DNA-binding ferritin-like protein
MTKIGITDVANGINEVRDMTAAELAEYNALINDVQTKKALAKAQKDEAEAALISSLGLTRDQVIALGLIQADYVKPSYE